MKNDMLATLERLGLELRFQRAIEELRGFIIDNNQSLGDLKGEIVLKIGVAGRRGEAERGQRVGDFAGFTFTVHDAQVKKPARLGKEIRTYLDGESVVVDPSTVDESSAQIALFHNRNHIHADAE